MSPSNGDHPDGDDDGGRTTWHCFIRVPGEQEEVVVVVVVRGWIDRGDDDV